MLRLAAVVVIIETPSPKFPEMMLRASRRNAADRVFVPALLPNGDTALDSWRRALVPETSMPM